MSPRVHDERDEERGIATAEEARGREKNEDMIICYSGRSERSIEKEMERLRIRFSTSTRPPLGHPP